MNNSKLMQWVLRIAVAGEFIGHGAFALQGKAQWVGWIQKFGVADAALATKLLFLVGVCDLVLALIVLVRPVNILTLWMAVWGFWTALVRPLVGESFWDFVERSANWGAPLALLLIQGWPKNPKEWFK